MDKFDSCREPTLPMLTSLFATASFACRAPSGLTRESDQCFLASAPRQWADKHRGEDDLGYRTAAPSMFFFPSKTWTPTASTEPKCAGPYWVGRVLAGLAGMGLAFLRLSCNEAESPSFVVEAIGPVDLLIPAQKMIVLLWLTGTAARELSTGALYGTACTPLQCVRD
jgi:hypothetical protein